MTVLFGLGVLSVWAACRLQPGTFLPPLSWPLIASCIWLALLYLRPRLNAADKRQAFAGLSAAALLLVFLLQDTEFSGWGDVYYFCGSRMQYCTCTHRWNLAGWAKAGALWAFVLCTTLGVQRLLIEVVLQGLLPGEEVVARESMISICWRLIPYWLNVWEQQWGAECSSMTFELPQFAVELLIILPCVQILCSRMKVLAMPSVNAALPRGWDGASPEQIKEAFVPNVQRGCWERRPEQQHFLQRVRANKHVTAFAALLCLLACTNSLYVPLHLEDAVLAHPRTAAMQAVGRLPELWGSPADLGRISSELQNGTMNMTHSFVTQEALKQVQQGRRPGRWHPGRLPPVDLAQHVMTAASPEWGLVGEVVVPPGARRSSSFVTWLAAVELGPWQWNGTWAAQAVEGLRQGLVEYRGQCPESATHHFQHNAWKHHYDIFRMRDPNHRLSVPLIEAALAVMRLSTEKFFVLLSLYVAFLLFRTPPPAVARLISITARVSNAFARMVLYTFPCVCWVYGAGFVFSSLVSVVFWGGPLWQVFHGLRTHACTVSVKGLRPATAEEIERMHNDCAICWCPMTVPGAAQQADSTSEEPEQPATPRGDPTEAANADGGSNSTDGSGQAAGTGTHSAVAGTGSAEAGVEAPAAAPAAHEHAAQAAAGAAAASGELGDSAGSTLPCGHCYHQTCLTQWLQQCHGQGTTPTCPMCQARMQLAVKWHVCKAIFAPAVWQLPARRRGRAAEQGGGAQPEGAEQPVAVQPAHNNYLLLHNPHLAELLADMPALLAPEQVQLLADVQELRWQRQQLAAELHLRQRQLQRLEGRHHELEVRLELQRQQLLQELQLLGQQLHRQQQQQERQGPAFAGRLQQVDPERQGPPFGFRPEQGVVPQQQQQRQQQDDPVREWQESLRRLQQDVLQRHGNQPQQQQPQQPAGHSGATSEEATQQAAAVDAVGGSTERPTGAGSDPGSSSRGGDGSGRVEGGSSQQHDAVGN